jgi:hypothetical protein
MNGLYWFAFVVGVGMFLFSLAADIFGDADVDAGGADIDVDADVDVDVHVDADGHAGHDTADFRILSVRNATYFLFAFGVTGVILTWLTGGTRPFVTVGVATALGITGAAISTLAFGWVRRTEAGDLPTDRGWIGLTGRVMLPLSMEGSGKILVVRGSREHELLARPFDRDPVNPEQWVHVTILDMKSGVALVAPGDPALEEPERRRIAPRSEA